MREAAVERGAVLRLVLQELCDKVAGAGGDICWELQINLGNPFVRRLVPFGFKGRLAHQELVAQHPERPQVDVAVVRLALDHLGREVVERAAERGPARRRCMHRPTKIGNLQLPLESQQEVLGLDVTVDHVFLVDVSQRLAELLDVESGARFREPRHRLQLFVQLPPRGVFKDEIHSGLVVEVRVQPEDVWMPQMGLVLDFPPELMFHV
mmetsp:Transcript_12027/g.30948  ORF Transcript_12027/g.30948 Transcript_12027/m.30948 type:complete len:209 (+) Transcript_12027:209-835(+)